MERHNPETEGRNVTIIYVNGVMAERKKELLAPLVSEWISSRQCTFTPRDIGAIKINYKFQNTNTTCVCTMLY